MAYKRPVAELQRVISSSHFVELQAYSLRNTLSPDLWWSTALATSTAIAYMTGEWVDPKFLVPGQVDPEKLKQQKEAAAERSMDRQAE